MIGENMSSEMRRPPISLALSLGFCDARPGPCCKLIDSCTLPKALPKLAGDMRVTGCKLGPKPLTGSTSREVGSFSTLGPREERAAGADEDELAWGWG